jgi:hypothetical protein
MDADLLGFFQERMARAYEEQVWAIALVAGMNAFVAGYADQLLTAIKYRVAATGMLVVSALALLFVWSRHFIYTYYNDLMLRVLDDSARSTLPSHSGIPPFLQLAVNWSGVTLYSLIIVGMCFAALRMLREKNRHPA